MLAGKRPNTKYGSLFINSVRNLVRALGFDLIRYPLPEQEPLDLSPDLFNAVALSRKFTMTTSHRLASTVDAIRYVCENSIRGAIVECGVWRGGNMMAAAYTLLSLAENKRQLYLYDTFAGMTDPSDSDRDYRGISAATMMEGERKGTGVWAEASLDDVQANLRSTGYPFEQIRFIQGPVEDTIPRDVPGEIAVLRLDTDWYQSTKHELQHLYPRLQSGGVLIIDDYGHWQGAKRAVDEYFKEQGMKPLLARIDYTCRIMIK